MTTTFSADRENETRTEHPQTPRAAAPSPVPESFDKETTARPEASDSRETVERGYGWGV